MSRSEICCDFRHGAEGDAVVFLDVFDQSLQHQHPATLADTLRMHGQHENAGLELFIQILKLSSPDIVDVVRRAQPLATTTRFEVEVGPIVQYPVERQDDQIDLLAEFMWSIRAHHVAETHIGWLVVAGCHGAVVAKAVLYEHADPAIARIAAGQPVSQRGFATDWGKTIGKSSL